MQKRELEDKGLTSELSNKNVNEVPLEEKKKIQSWLSQPLETLKILENSENVQVANDIEIVNVNVISEDNVGIIEGEIFSKSSPVADEKPKTNIEENQLNAKEESSGLQEEKEDMIKDTNIIVKASYGRNAGLTRTPEWTEGSSMDIEKLRGVTKKEENMNYILVSKITSTEQEFGETSLKGEDNKKSKIAFSSVCMVETVQAHKGIDEKDKGVEILSTKDVCMPKETACPDHETEEASESSDGAKYKLIGSLVTAPIEEVSSAKSGLDFSGNLEESSSTACDRGNQEMAELNERMKDVNMNKDGVQSNKLQPSLVKEIEDLSSQKVGRLETSKEESETRMKNIVRECQNEEDNKNEILQNIATTGKDDENHRAKPDVSFTDPKESIVGKSENLTPTEALTIECEHEQVLVVTADGNTLAEKQDKAETSKHEEHLEQSFMQKTEPTKENLGRSSNAASAEIETTAPDEYAETIAKIEEQRPLGDPEEILGERRKEETTMGDIISEEEIPEEKNLSKIDVDEKIRGAESKISNKNGNDLHVHPSIEEMARVGSVSGDQVHDAFAVLEEDEKHVNETNEAHKSPKSTILEDTFTEMAINIDVSLARSEMYNAEETIIEKHCELNSEDNLRGEPKQKEKDFDINFQKATDDDYEKSTIEEDVPVKYSTPLYCTGEEEYHHDQEDKNRPIGSKEASPELDSADQSHRMTDKTKDITDQIIKEEVPLNYINNSIKCPSQVYQDPKMAGTEEDTENEINNKEHTVADRSPSTGNITTKCSQENEMEEKKHQAGMGELETNEGEGIQKQLLAEENRVQDRSTVSTGEELATESPKEDVMMKKTSKEEFLEMTADGSANIGIGIRATDEDGKAKDNFATSDGEETKNECSYVEGEGKEPDTVVPQVIERVAHREIIKDQITEEEICTEELPMKPVVDETADEVTDLDLRPIQSLQGTVLNNNTGMLKSEVAELNPELEASPMTKALEEEIEKPMDVDTSFDDISEQNLQASSTQSQEEENIGKPEESETKGEALNKSKTLDAKAESPSVAEKTEEEENKDESTIPGKDTIMGSTVTEKESIYDDAQDEDEELSTPCELKNDKKISESDVEKLLKREKTKEVANSSVIGISKTTEEKSSDVELDKEKYEYVMAVNEASSSVQECGKCINTDEAIPEHGDSVKSEGSSKESAEIERASVEFEEEVHSHGSEASNSSISTSTETKIETAQHGEKLGSSSESMTEDKNNRRFPETNQTSPEEESCDDVNGIIDSTKEEVSGQHIQEGKEKMSKEMEPERETQKEFNEIQDTILTAKVPIEIERPVVTEIIKAQTTKEESSSKEPVADETVNKVANLELTTPIHNLEATASSNNTEMVKSNVAKDLNQESEASLITKAFEEETEKPSEVSSSITEVSEEKIKEEKIEDAQNCDGETDTAPTMATDVTNTEVLQLNDQPIKALDTSSDTLRLARTKTTDPCQQDAEVDSMKLEEISGMMSELPTHDHEKADDAEAKETKISSVISKNTDWGKKEIHETDTILSVGQTDKHENEIQISEAPKALFESINKGVEAASDDKITSLGHVKLNDKPVNAFDYSSDAKSKQTTEISETSQQDTEVENKKLEENSSTVSQFPKHENLENDNESMTVEKSHANNVEVEEIDIPHAAPESENQAVQELKEASTSLTTGDTDTNKTEKHIRQVPDLLSKPTNQDVQSHANDVEVEEINVPGAAPESENQAVQEFPEGGTSLSKGDTDTNETEKHIRQVPDSLSEPINQDVEAAKDDKITHGQTLQTEKIEQLQVPSPNLLSEEKDHETTTPVKEREDGKTKKDETEVGCLMLDENAGIVYQLPMTECDISNNVIVEQSDAEEIAVRETKILDAVSESKSQGVKEIHKVDLVSPSNVDSHEIGTIAPSDHAEKTTKIKEDEHVGSTETVTTDVINKETAEEKNLSKLHLDEMEIPNKNVNYLNVIHPPVEETVQLGGENQDESGDPEPFEITKEEEKHVTETYKASKSKESTILEHMSTEGKLAMEVTSTSEMDVKLEKDCEVNSEDKLKEINAEENIKEETGERENTSHTDLQIAIKFEALKNGKNLDGKAETPSFAKKTEEDITEDKVDSTNPEKDANMEPTVIENKCINVNVWDEEEQEFYVHCELKNDKTISESDAEILKEGKSKEIANPNVVGKLKNSEEAKSPGVELEKEKHEYVNVVNDSFEECGKCTGTTSEAILELEDPVNSDGGSKESIEVERAPVEFEEKVHTHGSEASRNISTSTPTETNIKTDDHGEKLRSFPEFFTEEKSKRRFPLTNQSSIEERSCDDVNQITNSTKEEISGQDTQEGKKKMNKETEPEIETKKELNEIQDAILTAEVPAEIERAVETKITKHQTTKEPHVMPVADETVNEVANQDLTSIQNLEATVFYNNTEMVKSNVAKDLNQESEASPTKKALEEETEKPADVSSSPAEVTEENIMEDNIKEAQNFDDEADNAPTMDIILTNAERVQLNDQTLKAHDIISDAPSLARTKTVDPSQQDAEVDSMKVEEISSMISQIPTQEHEKADVAEAKETEILGEISKYKDQGKKELHETDAGLSVRGPVTNENDKHIIEVPEVFSESMGETDTKETEKQIRQVLESLSEPINQDVESVRDDEITPGQTFQTKKIEEQLQVPFPNLLSKGDSETTTTIEETEHGSTKDDTEVDNLMLEENSGILYQLPITECDGANNVIVEKSDEVAVKETKTLDTLFESESQGFKESHMVDLASPTNVGSEEIETTSSSDYVEMTTNIEEKGHVGSAETITTDDINKDYPKTKNLSKLDLEEMTRSADVEIPNNSNDLCVTHPPVEETVQLRGENQDEVSASESGDHETFGVNKEEEKHGTERYEAKIPKSTTLEHMSTEEAIAMEVTSTSEMDVKLEKGCKVNLEEELKETNAEERIKEETEQKEKASDTDFQIAMKSHENEKSTTEEDVPVIDSNPSCIGEEEYYHDQEDKNRPNSSKEASPELASEDQSSTTSNDTKNTNDKIRNKEAIQLYKDPKISDIGEDLTEGEIKHNKHSVTDYSSESTGKHTTKCSDKEEEDKEPTTAVLETKHGGQDAAEHIIINSVRYQSTESFIAKPVQESSQDDKASEGYWTAIKSRTTEESAITDLYLSSVGQEKLEESIKEDERDSIISENEVRNSNKCMEQTFDATCSTEERSLEDKAEKKEGFNSQGITGSSKEEIAQEDRNLDHVEKSKLVPKISKKEIKEEILEKADSKVTVIAEETRLTQGEAEYVMQIDSFNQVSEEKGSVTTEPAETGSNGKDIAAEPEETSILGENDTKIQTAEKHGTDEASEASEASEITSDVPKNDNKLYGKAEHEKADNESITVAKSYVELEETKISEAVPESEDQGEKEIQETSKALSMGKNATDQSSEIEFQIIKIPQALSKPINQGVEVARDDETTPGQTLQAQKIEEQSQVPPSAMLSTEQDSETISAIVKTEDEGRKKHDREVDSLKPEENSNMVSQLPKTECERENAVNVERSDADEVEVRESKTLDAITEPKDQGFEKVHEPKTSPTIENTATEKIGEEIKGVSERKSDVICQGVDTVAESKTPDHEENVVSKLQQLQNVHLTVPPVTDAAAEEAPDEKVDGNFEEASNMTPKGPIHRSMEINEGNKEISSTEINYSESFMDNEKMEYTSLERACEGSGVKEDLDHKKQEICSNKQTISCCTTTTQEKITEKKQLVFLSNKQTTDAGSISEEAKGIQFEEKHAKNEEPVELSTMGNERKLNEAKIDELTKVMQELGKASLVISHEQRAYPSESTETTNPTAIKNVPLMQDDPTTYGFNLTGYASGPEAEENGVKCGEEKTMDEESEETTEKSMEIESGKNSLSDLLQRSTRQTLQVVEHLIEETALTSKEEQEQTGPAETVVVEEAKTDEEEGDEHIKVDLGSDAPVNVEASSEIDVKIAHKKSHNILSGVGSKVKHSLAKVKKVITGKSPHGKPSSPK